MFLKYLFVSTVFLSSLVFLLLLPSSTFAGTFFYEDDFTKYGPVSDGSPNWENSSVAWTVHKGWYECTEINKDLSILKASPWGEMGQIEATIVIDSTTAPEWKVAGIGLYVDPNHYWQFSLSQEPGSKGGKRFIELTEMYAGTWLAQSEKKTALKGIETITPQVSWEFGTPYRLKLEWNYREIRGSLMDPRGVLLARRGYTFGSQPSVRLGKPMLVCGGFRAAFQNFQARASGEEKYNATSSPVAFPKYTAKGFKDIRGTKTDFFHVEEIDGRWWVIDPNGNSFYVVGTDHCNYNVHWCEKLGYAPYNKFCATKYGSEETWARSATDRLLKWKFNTLGANNSPSTRYKGLAYTEFLGFGSEFSRHENICQPINWTGFPNVFSPKFREFCMKQARKRCASLKDDPWLLGYFIDNELEWFGKSYAATGLCDEAFKKPAKHSAKIALVNFFKQRHRTVEDFNKAWGTRLESYGEILESTEAISANTEIAKNDKMDFVRLIADKYFEVTTSSIRKYDPNHLILGIRFAGEAPVIWDVAGKYCDIVSVNCYRNLDLNAETFVDGFPEDLEKWYGLCKRPMMITEWSFPALDSGLPCVHGAGQRFDTQIQRAQAFSVFQRKIFSTPFLVGSMYFMWVDEPALGISTGFPEDSNYGLVNEKDEPYKELTETATRINAEVYNLHSGLSPQLRAQCYDDEILEVTNYGPSDADTNVVIYLDGVRKSLPLKVKSGHSTSIRLPRPMLTGGHFLSGTLDPEKRLVEPDATQHQFQSVKYVPGLEIQLDLQGSWLPIVAANPSTERMQQFIARIPLSEIPEVTCELWSPGAQPQVVCAVGYTTQNVPAQIDKEADGLVLSMLLDNIEPRGAKTIYLNLDGLVSSATEAPQIRVTEGPDCGKTIDNGRLKLEHNGKNAIFDRVSLDGEELGRFQALIHQMTDEDLWTTPDKVESATIQCGPVKCTIQFVLSYSGNHEYYNHVKTKVDNALGIYPPVFTRPLAFRVAYEIEVYPGQPWFSSRFLWLENTDREPFQFKDYLHYALSNIRGDSSDDEPVRLGVPSHLVTASSWFDPTAQLHYGALVPLGSGLSLYFWKDPSGQQHPDVYKRVDVTLAPGQRYNNPGASVCVFGAKGDKDSGPWTTLWKEFSNWRTVQIKTFPK